MVVVLGVDLGTKNLAICAIASDSSIVLWQICNLAAGRVVCSLDGTCPEFPGAGGSRATIETLTDALGHYVKLLPPAQCAFIEVQPSTNVRTKVLSHVLQSLLATQGTTVRFRRAPGREERSYSKRKRRSVEMCLAQVDERCRAFLKEQPKTDDLADAFHFAAAAHAEAVAEAAGAAEAAGTAITSDNGET